MSETRREQDPLGEREVPAGALWGVHTLRALENFPLAGRPVHRALVRAFGAVKGACALTNQRLGAWAADPAKGDAIVAACAEMAAGQLDEHVVADALQGGAGTSTNMNVNEVLANRALQILGEPPHPGLTACRSPVPSLAPSREKFQCDEPEPCRAIMRCANRTETIFDRVRNVLQINNPEKRGSCAPRTPFRLWSWTDQG
jgi:hypothetical protein